MRKVKVALIGTGGFAQEHAREYMKIPSVDIVGVYGNEAKRRDAFARKFGIKSYPSLDECLNDREVEFVDVVCRHAEHVTYGLMAAKAGKHVIVEKPIGIKLEAARELVEYCRSNGVKLYVISQYRYDQVLRKIRREIESGTFGDVYAMNLSMNWHRPQGYYDSSGGWRKRPDISGGGVLMTQSIHWIDILLWFGGDVEGLNCETRTVSHQIDVEDTAAGQILFRSGAIATFQASTSACFMQPDRLEVHGTKGSCVVQSNRIVQWNFGTDGLGSRVRSRAASFLYSMLPWRRGRLGDQLVDIISGRAEPNGNEALKALEVILGLYGCKKERSHCRSTGWIQTIMADS